MLAEHEGATPPAFLKPSMVMVKVHAIAMLALGEGKGELCRLLLLLIPLLFVCSCLQLFPSSIIMRLLILSLL